MTGVNVEALKTVASNIRTTGLVVEVLYVNQTYQIISVSIHNDANVTQTWNSKRVLSRTIVNTADVTQAFVRNGIVFVSMSNSANVTQSNSFSVNHVQFVSVVSNASVSQNPFVNSPRIVSMTHNIGVFQSNETRHNITKFLSVTQGVSVSQGVFRRDITVQITISQGINVSQRIRSTYPIHVTSTASVTQTWARTRYIAAQNFANFLTPQNNFTRSREISHLLNHSLTLIDSFTNTGTFFRNLTDFQVMTSVFRSALIVRNLATHPVVTGTPVISQSLTIIANLSGQVVLPAAEWGDTFGAKVQMTMKRSITGKVYTYVRSNSADKFSLTWKLGVQKAYELAFFLRENIASKYLITLWNGEIYFASMIATNLPLTFEGKWQGVERERVSVTIDFEGEKLL